MQREAEEIMEALRKEEEERDVEEEKSRQEAHRLRKEVEELEAVSPTCICLVSPVSLTSDL